MSTAGVVLRIDRMAEVVRAVSDLTGTSVLVGVPNTTAGGRDGPISNAALAYIHDKGSPEAHIPPRPFMEPGIKSVQDKIAAKFEEAGVLAFAGSVSGIETTFNQVGLMAAQAIKAKISEGIPPPLAASTVRSRIYRLKNKKRRERIKGKLAEGLAESVQAGAEGAFLPLVLTGQLLKSITYVLRKTGRR